MIQTATTLALFSTIAWISLTTALPIGTRVTTGRNSSILSLRTRRFVGFYENGSLHANGDRGSPDTVFNVVNVGPTQVRIQFKKNGLDCFLVYENGQFRGSTAPVDGNEIFERETIQFGPHIFSALKVVNYPFDTMSGSGAEEASNSTKGTNTTTTEEPSDTTVTPPTTFGTNEAIEESTVSTTTEEQETTESSANSTVCYFGFEDVNTPKCFELKDMPETQFIIV